MSQEQSAATLSDAEPLALPDRDEIAFRRHPAYARLKPALDFALALILIVLSGPVMILAALLTRLSSPGPAFYRQRRVGRNGRVFVIFKIRTMAHKCEEQTGAVWASHDDQRVTALGRILRDTHIDEMPQFVNILRGEMSLVGPRPERPEIVPGIESKIPAYRQRLAVRPGLTGLAQIQLPADRDLNDVRQKLAYDLYYIQELSPGLDLRIMLGTIGHIAGLCLSVIIRTLTR